MNESLQLLIEKHIPNLKAYGFQLVVLLEQNPPDYEAIKSLAHMIKGSSSSLGFRVYSDLCVQIEAQCRQIWNMDRAVIDQGLCSEMRSVVENLAVEQSELFEKAS